MSIAALCPNCGASIAFHVSSSIVTVCEHCSTVVARTDRAYEDLGKTSDLAKTRSGLALWMGGTYRGVGFQLTGRAQLQHGAGGVWDEWYMAFDDGRWGWLAEAQGRFYVTFRQEGTLGVAASQLTPGSQVALGDPPVVMTVAETGEATLLTGRGEIPYRLEPGRRYWYADLSGPDNMFGTVDCSETPAAVFLGHQVSREELGLIGSGSELDSDMAAGMATPEVSTEAVSCDNCGGSLELHAPDVTERVACPYCGAMHDCNQGVLRFLNVAEGGRIEPSLALGSKARFEDQEFVLIGFMLRRTRGEDYQTYQWEEYLWYNPSLGFRWLVYSDNHWNYVKPISLAGIRARLPDSYHEPGEVAELDGKSYKIFQAGEAEVVYVAGEFYWRVEVGQKTHTADYIRPPEMLSGESGNNEINWSLGTYMTPAEVDACLITGATPSTHPDGVAPNQPYPHKAVYPVWIIMLMLSVGLLLWAQKKNVDRTVHTQRFDLPVQAAGTGEADLLFTDEFELAADVNVDVNVYAPQVSNSWVYAQADLYNKDTGTVYAFDIPVEYYFGVEGGESWSEGGRSKHKTLSAVPAGTYVIRLAVERSAYNVPQRLELTVKQGVFQMRLWLLLLFGVSFIPIGVGIHHFMFERRRWSNSDYAGGDDE